LLPGGCDKEEEGEDNDDDGGCGLTPRMSSGSDRRRWKRGSGTRVCGLFSIELKRGKLTKILKKNYK